MIEASRLAEIVKKAQNGDRAAMDILFENSYDDIYYFILKTVKDPDLAGDLTQETFMTVYKNIGSLKEPAAFVTWIRRIAYHSCTGHFKKQTDVLVEEDEDGGSIFDTLSEEGADFIPHDALDQDEFKKTILEIINQLTEEQRAAVLMFYYEELSVKQIAEIQNVSEGTVKSRLNYARKAIKESVEGYEREHNIKLHSVSILPLLLWFFKKDNALVPKRFPNPRTDLPSSAPKVGKAAKAARKAAGASAKASFGGIALKIVAVVVAATVIIGAGAAGGVALIYGAVNGVFGGNGNSKNADNIENVAEIFASGSGTQEDPYVIETTEQLLEFANLSNSIYQESDETVIPFKDAHICLGETISLNGTGPINDTSLIGIIKAFIKANFSKRYDWVTIEMFGGVFDGNGHEIYGLNNTMFGTIAEGGVIRNLSISAGTIKGNAVIAESNYSVIQGCTVDSSVTLNCTSKETDYIGGIVASNFGVVYDIDCRADINADYASAAGIVGMNHGIMAKCDFSGKVNSQHGETKRISFGEPQEIID